MPNKFIPWIFLFCLLVANPARAENNSYELRFSPGFGYSNFNGFSIGESVILELPLSGRWQWTFGEHLGLNKRVRAFSVWTGPLYNFSDDRSRSYFLGGGAGWSDREFYVEDEDVIRHRSSAFAYVEFGKRFRLNDSGTWTWMPSLQVQSKFDGRVDAEVKPFTFSWSF